MAWDRILWGVEFRGRDKEEPPIILGTLWHDQPHRRYFHEDEPTRALLFCTRKQARDWCRQSNERDGHLDWKYTPIKVRERVAKITEESSNG